MSCRERLQYSGYRRRTSLPKSNRSSTYSTAYTSNYSSNSSSTYNSKRNSLYSSQYELSYSRSSFSCSQSSLELQTNADLTDCDKEIKKLLRRTEKFESRVEKLQKGIGKFVDQSDNSAELEWKRFLDAGILIEKAVDMIKQRCRAPKTFVYSPEGPSPRAYDVPSDTILVSIPYSPSDDEDYSNGSST